MLRRLVASVWFLLPACLLVGIPCRATHAQEAAARAAVPDGAALARAEGQFKSQHKEAVVKAQSDAAARSALVAQLLDQARELKKDSPERFLWLREARDLAAQAGDTATAFQAIEEMAQTFAVQVPDMQADVLTAAVTAVGTPEAAKTLVDVALGLVADAVDGDSYDRAVRLGKLAEDAARKAKSLPLVLAVQKQERGLVAASEKFGRLQAVADRLSKNPEDAGANLEMGRYLCLLKGSWERGLFLLAQGSDPALRLQAQRDLIRPDSAREKIEVGDAWWELADREKDQVQVHLRQRAAHWYEQALTATEGLVRGRLEERIAAVPRPHVSAAAWDYSGRPGEIRVLRGLTSTVYGVAFSPDGRKVLTGCVDGRGALWDAGTGQQLHQLQGHVGMIWGVAFDPRGRRVFTGSWDGTVKMWDADKGVELRRFPGQARIADINGVAVSPDGKRLLTGSDDSVVRLWDVDTGQEVRQLRGHAGLVYGVAFSPDGKQALSGGSGDGTMILWDVQTGQVVRRFVGLRGAIRVVAFSRDGRRALSTGDNVFQMWDLKTGQEVRRFQGHTQVVHAVAFSPDGRRILSGSADMTVRLWDAATGRELHRFEGHASAVFTVAFSPGGGRAVSGSADNTVRLWGLPR